jgi:hypothetical protein
VRLQDAQQLRNGSGFNPFLSAFWEEHVVRLKLPITDHSLKFDEREWPGFHSALRDKPPLGYTRFTVLLHLFRQGDRGKQIAAGDHRCHDDLLAVRASNLSSESVIRDNDGHPARRAVERHDSPTQQQRATRTALSGESSTTNRESDGGGASVRGAEVINNVLLKH